MANYSDRDLGIRAGTRPPGNDVNIVYETIRKQGIIPESFLPFSDELKTVEEYYSYKGGDKSKCDNEAKQWIRDVFFKHEYLPTTNGQISQETLKLTLQRSPVAVGVDAWNYNSDTGKYVRLGADGHWTCIVGYKDNDYFLIYDTYVPFLKKLDWDFGFSVGKKIHLRKKTEEEKKIEANLEQQVSLMQKVVELLKKLIYFLTS